MSNRKIAGAGGAYIQCLIRRDKIQARRGYQVNNDGCCYAGVGSREIDICSIGEIGLSPNFAGGSGNDFDEEGNAREPVSNIKITGRG